jgi:YHS domain-containing protein
MDLAMEGITTITSTFIDPVCGMEVEAGKARLVAIYQGHSCWFCDKACRESFEANPPKYLARKPTKRKGWFRSYLERLTNANREQFGSKGAKCH